ncbi:MAG: hypothetical protein MZV70_38860 [Desulfobacterales bacterium]|nr:hypothetical protein [Desulfobacterales bacterium]
MQAAQRIDDAKMCRPLANRRRRSDSCTEFLQSALASPSGLRVNSAADASARYSRWREDHHRQRSTDQWGKDDGDDPDNERRRPPAPLDLLLERDRPPPNRMDQRRDVGKGRRTVPTKAATTVITRMS